MIELSIKDAYLEVTIDDKGYCDLKDNILALREKKSVVMNDSISFSMIERKGYTPLCSLSLVLLPDVHIAGTDYNIMCFPKTCGVVELCMTDEGIGEVTNILEYVRSENEHFHLFGGFDLYTGENDPVPIQYISAITIYYVQEQK